jgi:hypothetical protein
MPTHPIYDLLLEGVNDELERKVLLALIKHAGKRISRPDLVFEVQGVYVQQGQLASSSEDRQNREAIEKLQARGYPVLASSGQAGYVLGGDDQELDDYLTELASRRARIDEKISHLRKARKWIPFIRQWIADRPIMQSRLF